MLEDHFCFFVCYPNRKRPFFIWIFGAELTVKAVETMIACPGLLVAGPGCRPVVSSAVVLNTDDVVASCGVVRCGVVWCRGGRGGQKGNPQVGQR